jgi:hypothetical protein
MQQVILDQIVAYPNLIFDANNALNSSDTIVAKCVERVKHEGNSHLLDVQDLPAIVEGQKRRLEIMLSRSRIRKAIYKSHQAYRLAKLVHPQSVIRRASYQMRHSADMLRRLASALRRHSPQKDYRSTSRTAPSHE